MLQVDERILIVDDEAAIRDAFSAGLSHHGYQCVTTGSAEDAEQALQQKEFSLMLLDIGLPNRSGLTILSEFTRRYPDMAIVMLTGNIGLDAAVLAMREGAYDYVTKPVSLGLLALRVEKALQRRSLRLEKTVDQLGNKADDDVELEPAIQEHNPPIEQAEGERYAESTVGADGTPEDGGMNFEVENADDSAIDFRLAASEFIMTGERVLDEKLGGGLPCGSLTLVEGASSSGKSVLCQHLIYGALTAGRGVACYSSEFTFKSLLTRMHSIGLDLSDAPKGVKLTVEALEDPLPDEDCDVILAALVETMQNVPDSVELLIIDAITNLASYSGERAILRFFSACKRMCAAGKTVIVVAHSSTFQEGMSVRLRAMSDGYLSLRVENVGDKLMKSLEVRKVLNAEASTGNVIFFDVEPGMGIRVNPFSRARV